MRITMEALSEELPLVTVQLILRECPLIEASREHPCVFSDPSRFRFLSAPVMFLTTFKGIVHTNMKVM